MSKPNWGIKRICPSCSMKYYDFDKSPIICPGCQFQFDPDLLLKSRKGRGFANKSEDSTSVEEDQVSNIVEDENIIPLNDEEQILEIDEESDINSENDVDENVDKSLETDIDEVDDDIPFVEHDLDNEVDDVQNDESIEITDQEDKQQ